MNRTLTLIVSCLFLLMFERCQDSFNPSPTFEPKMVVYSVLTTNSNTQYVRVYSTYFPKDNNPLDNPDETPVRDAQVTVAEEGGPVFSFNSFSVQRIDTSRYVSLIGAYRAYPFRPGKGKTYSLTVTSASMGRVTAKTTVCKAGIITMINPPGLNNPCFGGSDFGLNVALASEAKGYLTRIYLDYLYPGSYGYQPARIEIPLRRKVISAVYDVYELDYPIPLLRSTPPSDPESLGNGQYYRPNEQVAYSSTALCSTVDFLYDRQGCVHFQQAVIYLMQFDAPLWKYYSVANDFRDKLSTRIDEPSYTNLSNGVGVFGSVTVDDTVWTYIPSIIPYHVPRGTAGCH